MSEKAGRLSQALLSELANQFPTLKIQPIIDAAPIARIPGIATEVGDIAIWVERDEITIGIGRLHHAHFDVDWESADTPEAKLRSVVARAVGYIQDIVDERVRIRLEFEQGRCLSSSTWYPDTGQCWPPLAQSDEIREYTWSGRIR